MKTETPQSHPKMTRDDVMRETFSHVRRVGNLMLDIGQEINRRAMSHDDSKFSAEEFESFARETPGHREITYGSDEYRAALDRIRPVVNLHQKRNRHHPEYHDGGVCDMTLIDLIEMLADWKAAGERHADGSIVRSIEICADRFDLSAEMTRLLQLTAASLGWCDGSDLKAAGSNE